MLRLRFFRVVLKFLLNSYFVFFLRLSRSGVLPFLAIVPDGLDCYTLNAFLFIRRIPFFILEAVPYNILIVGFLLLLIRLTLSALSLRYYLGFVETFY
jgi:hypothetical protein